MAPRSEHRLVRQKEGVPLWKAETEDEQPPVPEDEWEARVLQRWANPVQPEALTAWQGTVQRGTLDGA